MLNKRLYSRNDFHQKLRTVLKNGLHKIMCGKIALTIGKPQPDNLSIEVENILKEIKKLMDATITDVKAKNRKKILAEAINESAFSYMPIYLAKNKVEDDYPKLWKEIKALRFEPEVEFKKMINDFLPEYNYLMRTEEDNHD